MHLFIGICTDSCLLRSSLLRASRLLLVDFVSGSFSTCLCRVRGGEWGGDNLHGNADYLCRAFPVHGKEAYVCRSVSFCCFLVPVLVVAVVAVIKDLKITITS